jgi:hypothetical protein
MPDPQEQEQEQEQEQKVSTSEEMQAHAEQKKQQDEEHLKMLRDHEARGMTPLSINEPPGSEVRPPTEPEPKDQAGQPEPSAEQRGD